MKNQIAHHFSQELYRWAVPAPNWPKVPLTNSQNRTLNTKRTHTHTHTHTKEPNCPQIFSIFFFCSFCQLDNLSQQELASRLTLNCMNCYVEPQKLRDLDITIMDVRSTPNLVLLCVFWYQQCLLFLAQSQTMHSPLCVFLFFILLCVFSFSVQFWKCSDLNFRKNIDVNDLFITSMNTNSHVH